MEEIKIGEDKVFLKKDMFGWRTVQPYVIDGKKQWGNIIYGGKKNIPLLFFMILITGMMYLGINQLVGNYKLIAEEPCRYCVDCREETLRVISNSKALPGFNLSSINLTGVVVDESSSVLSVSPN